jgi:hypothetical protein
MGQIESVKGYAATFAIELGLRLDGLLGSLFTQLGESSGVLNLLTLEL